MEVGKGAGGRELSRGSNNLQLVFFNGSLFQILSSFDHRYTITIVQTTERHPPSHVKVSSLRPQHEQAYYIASYLWALSSPSAAHQKLKITQSMG